MDLQAALGQNPPSFDISLSKLRGLKQPGSPGAVFRPFSKFRVVYKEGSEISRQFWNKIFPFFSGNLVCRWSSNSKIVFNGLTADFFHVEVGRRVLPPKHGGSLQLARRNKLAFPEIFSQTHTAFGVERLVLLFQERADKHSQVDPLSKSCPYRMFGYKAVKQSDLQQVCVLRGTQTH